MEGGAVIPKSGQRWQKEFSTKEVADLLKGWQWESTDTTATP